MILDILLLLFCFSAFTVASRTGTFTPSLYFATRQNSPKDNFKTGLIYQKIQDGLYKPDFRYSCEQGDNLRSYGYSKHDAKQLAKHFIVDKYESDQQDQQVLVLNTTMINHSREHDFSVKITGNVQKDQQEVLVHVMYYFAMDGKGSLYMVDPSSSNTVKHFVGQTSELGKFKVVVTDVNDRTLDKKIPKKGRENILPSLDATSVFGMKIRKGDTWKIKDPILKAMMENAQALFQKTGQPIPHPAHLFSLPNNVDEVNNKDFNVFVVSKMVSTPFEFDVAVLMESTFPQISGKEGVNKVINDLTKKALTTKIEIASSTFDERFEKTFALKAKGYDDKHVEFAQTLMSNLMGGIGFFHGKGIVDRALEGFPEEEPTDYLPNASPDQPNDSDDDDDDEFNDGTGSPASNKKPLPDPKEEGPFSLFTATPSRPFFPRGFYWDEGFHQLLIGEWDNDLSLEIIKSWTNLFDDNGWVGREQILGLEARSKVPKEFQTQYPHFANPPTLLLSIEKYIQRLSHNNSENAIVENTFLDGNFIDTITANATHDANVDGDRATESKAKEDLKFLYTQYKKRYAWFKRTQWGILPRSLCETCEFAFRWRGRTDVHTLTSGLDDYPRSSTPHPKELHVDLISWVAYMARTLYDMSILLEAVEESSTFEKEFAGIMDTLEKIHWDEVSKSYTDVTFDEDTGEYTKVVHKGYISLFPFVLTLLPVSSEKLGHILELIRDENHLWSRFGVSSLSKQDVYFGKGENYWRGPIWININYLILSALHKYKNGEGVLAEKAGIIYAELRTNLVDTVFKSWEETGYMWEQYSSQDGKGKRSHPFTGWTSLIVLIMSENY